MGASVWTVRCAYTDSTKSEVISTRDSSAIKAGR